MPHSRWTLGICWKSSEQTLQSPIVSLDLTPGPFVMHVTRYSTGYLLTTLIFYLCGNARGDDCAVGLKFPIMTGGKKR